MADDTVPAPPSEPSGGDANPERPLPLPMTAFVYGGTHTSRHDNHVAAIEYDAQRRRAEADAERFVADQHGIHRGNPDDVATLYESEMTDHSEIMKAYVPLEYLSKNHREVDYAGVGDIVMPQDPAFDDELMLLIFCPRCKEGGMPAGQAILQIRQSNRHWELDVSPAGEMFVFEGQALRSAGRVMACEPFTCAQCNWRAKIDDNKVIPL